MRTIDYEAHNAEVKEVWDAYRERKPIRPPMVFGINPRFTMFDPAVNPRKISFQQYLYNPQLMLERQLEHCEWIRLNVPQDAEMGIPKAGWPVYVDFQNTVEAAWLGSEVRFYDNQVPDTEPILSEESRKNQLFDQGIPDPFRGGMMKRGWEYYDYFQEQKTKGFTYKGLPIDTVGATGLGTDGPMTVACNLRGATEFLTDLLAEPDYARRLLDFVTEAAIVRITAYRKKLGQPLKTPGWGFADDSIQLISTDLYQEMVYPFHKRLVDTFSEGGPNSIHLCGDATRHFPFLRDHLNIQSFDTGFPVDFPQLREDVGPDVEIFGGPSVPFLIDATPETTAAEVRRVLDSGIRNGGRFVLREGNNLAPGISLDNLWTMYETNKRYGRYT
ncbi:MAG: hypothetical protein HZB26_18700 [Candidatus Hydrogenedentes bacterium]|nr:hypothetical protein [Candidatus Hydrogenedentota bacterium]